MALTNEQILQEIRDAMIYNTNAKKHINEALTHAMTAIQNMDKRLAEKYEAGCIDAWDLARDVVVEPRLGGYTRKEIIDIFGIRATSEYILDNYTYTQAIAKVNEYEEKKAKEKEVTKPVRGDEVRVDGACTHFTGIYLGECAFNHWVIHPDCTAPQSLDKSSEWTLTKTGRHVDLFISEQ